jgi:peptidyl-prolyl cis-trans isomerase D
VVVPPVDFESEATKQLKTTLNNSVSEDLFQQYVTLLEGEVGVTINQKALQQILSGQNPTDD